MNDLIIQPSLTSLAIQWLASWVRRLTGFHYAERRLIKFSWAEISHGLGLSLELIYWGRGEYRHPWSLKIHLLWPCIFFTLPFPALKRDSEDFGGEYWGFSFQHGRNPFQSVHLNWGRHVKIIDMPWCWESIPERHEVWTPWGWRAYQFPWTGSEKNMPDGRRIWTYPFIYHRRNGEMQQRIASVHVERGELRWRWLKALPWPRLRWQSIQVEFNGEVGEETGSWKGGCVGCGEYMRPGETPLDTLRRMERERKF